MKAKFSNKIEAKRWLLERYVEQAQSFPLLVGKVPIELYIRRNLEAAMRMTTSTLPK